MRCPMLTLAGLSILLATGIPAWAQNAGARGGQGNRNFQGGLNLPLMAQQIFLQADRNHNNVLNRYEFSTAQMLTDNTIANLGRAGMIGRGRQLNFGQFQAAGMGVGGMGQVRAAGLGQLGGGLLGGQINNSKFVTQPQFTNYFQNAVARADAMLRQYFANNRNGYGRNYRRYGHNYGRGRYGYGRPSYGYSQSRHSTLAATPNSTTTQPVAAGKNLSPTPTTGSTASGSNLAGPSFSQIGGSRRRGTSPAGIGLGIGSTPGGLAVGNSLVGKSSKSSAHAKSTVGKHSYHKASLMTGASSSTGNASSNAARARVTAMAQARAQARHSFSSGGGGGGGGQGGGHSGGGHGGGGGHSSGGGSHSGGGGGHGGGGHHGGHR
jgi:hypothetical protein